MPVGVVAPLACLTVADSVIDEFCVMVKGEDVSVVVVLTTAAFTLTETAADVEALKFVAPEYAAVMESVPTGSEDVESVAAPEDSVAEPSEVAPL